MLFIPSLIYSFILLLCLIKILERLTYRDTRFSSYHFINKFISSSSSMTQQIHIQIQNNVRLLKYLFTILFLKELLENIEMMRQYLERFSTLEQFPFQMFYSFLQHFDSLAFSFSSENEFGIFLNEKFQSCK
jgi:hypothetical protein